VVGITLRSVSGCACRIRRGRAPHRLRRCRAAPGSRMRAHPLRGLAAPALRIPGAGTRGLRPLDFPWSDLPAAGSGARRAAVPVRVGLGRCCRFPVLFAFSGDSAPAVPGDRLRLQGGVHNACALRMLPPCSPVPAVAVVHRAKNSGKRRPAPGRRPMRTGTLPGRAL